MAKMTLDELKESFARKRKRVAAKKAKYSMRKFYKTEEGKMMRAKLHAQGTLKSTQEVIDYVRSLKRKDAIEKPLEVETDMVEAGLSEVISPDDDQKTVRRKMLKAMNSVGLTFEVIATVLKMGFGNDVHEKVKLEYVKTLINVLGLNAPTQTDITSQGQPIVLGLRAFLEAPRAAEVRSVEAEAVESPPDERVDVVAADGVVRRLVKKIPRPVDQLVVLAKPLTKDTSTKTLKTWAARMGISSWGLSDAELLKEINRVDTENRAKLDEIKRKALE